MTQQQSVTPGDGWEFCGPEDSEQHAIDIVDDGCYLGWITTHEHDRKVLINDPSGMVYRRRTKPEELSEPDESQKDQWYRAAAKFKDERDQLKDKLDRMRDSSHEVERLNKAYGRLAERLDKAERFLFARSRGLGHRLRGYSDDELLQMFRPFLVEGDTSGLSPRECRLLETIREQNNEIADTHRFHQQEISTLMDGMERAWTVIANVSIESGNWDAQSGDWVRAAEEWRDKYWNPALDRHVDSSRPDPESCNSVEQAIVDEMSFTIDCTMSQLIV